MRSGQAGQILPSAALAWRQKFALAYGFSANQSPVRNKPDRSERESDYGRGPIDGLRGVEHEIGIVDRLYRRHG
jgi:hypothetical protein